VVEEAISRLKTDVPLLSDPNAGSGPFFGKTSADLPPPRSPTIAHEDATDEDIRNGYTTPDGYVMLPTDEWGFVDVAPPAIPRPGETQEEAELREMREEMEAESTAAAPAKETERDTSGRSGTLDEPQATVGYTRNCRTCQAVMKVQTWSSSDGGHEDTKYTCPNGHVEWVDGCDS
jgi:hypothetical protein